MKNTHGHQQKRRIPHQIKLNVPYEVNKNKGLNQVKNGVKKV